MKKTKYKKELNKQQYNKLINELCPNECKNRDCFLKDALCDLHPNPRLLIQIKCINKFKIFLAKEQRVKVKEINTSDAVFEWIERGYAEGFAEHYDEQKTFTQIYKETTAK